LSDGLRSAGEDAADTARLREGGDGAPGASDDRRTDAISPTAGLQKHKSVLAEQRLVDPVICELYFTKRCASHGVGCHNVAVSLCSEYRSAKCLRKSWELRSLWIFTELTVPVLSLVCPTAPPRDIHRLLKAFKGLHNMGLSDLFIDCGSLPDDGYGMIQLLTLLFGYGAYPSKQVHMCRTMQFFKLHVAAAVFACGGFFKPHVAAGRATTSSLAVFGSTTRVARSPLPPPLGVFSCGVCQATCCSWRPT